MQSTPTTPTRDQADDRVLSALVRDYHDTELLERVEDALDRQLAVFVALQALPGRGTPIAA
jgi:hypothetical protein